VVDVADVTGLGAAVVVEVVALGSRHLGSVTATNANRIVVLVGVAVAALGHVSRSNGDVEEL
jgi:hypothetical protein